MMMWQRDHAVPVAAWDKLPEEKREANSRLVFCIR